MQAVVTRINVAEGQTVAKGDLLVVLESMKMENYVYAPVKGTVTKIFVSPADGVEAGETLVTLDINGGGKDGKSGQNDGKADGKTNAAQPADAAQSDDTEQSTTADTPTTNNTTNDQSDDATADAKKEDVK